MRVLVRKCLRSDDDNCERNDQYHPVTHLSVEKADILISLLQVSQCLR